MADTTSMSAPTEREFLLGVLKGNVEAVRFVEVLGQISQIFDDLVDAPESVTVATKHELMWLCLLVLPNQPFYLANQSAFSAIIAANLFDWIAATQLERGMAPDRRIAFVIRDNLAQIVTYSAMLVGGPEHASATAAEVRRFVHDESWADYLLSLGEN